MRKPAIFFFLLGSMALASTLQGGDALADAPGVAPAAGVKISKGRFVLVLDAKAVNGKAFHMKRPIMFIGSGYRNNAGGFVMGGKNSPHLTGTISGNSFKATEPGKINLDGALSSNSQVAAATGNFTMPSSGGSVSGSFALVPLTTLGGKLLGGGPAVNNIPNGWGMNSGPTLGMGVEHWGYTGGGLFSGTERANLGGTTVSGESSITASELWASFCRAAAYVAGGGGGSSGTKANDGTPTADGSHSNGYALADAATALQTGTKPSMDSEEQGVLKDDKQSQDDRDTYGTGGFNSNLVLKGSDGGGTPLEFAGTAGSAVKGGVNKGDNPFEQTAADRVNLGKLFNGAIDPTPGK